MSLVATPKRAARRKDFLAETVRLAQMNFGFAEMGKNSCRREAKRTPKVLELPPISRPPLKKILCVNGGANNLKEYEPPPSRDTGGHSRAKRGAIKTNDFNVLPRRVYALRCPSTQPVSTLYSTRPSPLRFIIALVQT